MACIGAVHAICHPQLSVSLSLTLNHCTVLCEKGKKEKNNAVTFLLLAHKAESAILSFSHFITLIWSHVSLSVLSNIVTLSYYVKSREGCNFSEFFYVM